MRYPDLMRSFGAAAGDVLAAVRRRMETRSPRVRVRIGHSEAKVLPPDSSTGERLLSLASELVGTYERGAPGGGGERV